MKKQVENISFVKYVSLKDRAQYDYYLRYGNLKSEDLFKLGDFMDQDFGFVKDMQEHLTHSGLSWQIFIEEMAKKSKKTKKHIANMPLFNLEQARLFIKEEIKKIIRLESENLGHQASNEEQQAGIEKFSKYRAFLQFDNLANGDITRHSEVRKQKYSLCFAKLMLDADRAEFEKELHKIRSKRK